MSELKSKIIQSLEKDWHALFTTKGITELSQNIRDKMEAVAAEAEETAVRRHLSKKAMQFSKQYFRDTDHKKAISDRLSSAVKGVKLVSESVDLEKILAQNARMLYTKRQALVKAGFTEDEAFQIILAEVSAKKSR